MGQPKKLIEVAMPIKEISAESIRDGRVQHGHISSLHKWWARRPLPVCRAVVFSSLVPDPLDNYCPQSFKDAVKTILGKGNNIGDPYKPYEDIPYTAAVDNMEDNLRNRLLMFIGKFSDEFILNEKKGKKTDSKDQLSDACLIKWDNKNNEEIIGKARKLIWIAHNSRSESSFDDLLKKYDFYYQSIKEAESNLYNTINRHLPSEDILAKKQQLAKSINEFLERMPIVFDPFAGGGAIPLEVARLGCNSFGNDINPVAYIIQKGSIEFPQKFGKPIIYSKEEFIKLYGEEFWNLQPLENKRIVDGVATAILIANRLSFDVSYYTKKVLKNVEAQIANIFTNNPQGNKTIAYYWGRTALCSNPSCKAEVPLLRQFYLCNKNERKVYLKPIIEGKKIDFDIEVGTCNIEGWVKRGNLKCPCCGNITDVNIIKGYSVNNKLGNRLLCVIYDESNKRKYRKPTKEEEDSINYLPHNIEVPTEKMQRNSAGGDTFSWGIKTWGQLFSPRQLYTIHALVREINEVKGELDFCDIGYQNAISTYLGIWLDRLAARMTQFGLIDIGRETIVDLFGRQAIPMVLDYPELYPFAIDQTSWIVRFIEGESQSPFSTTCFNASSGERNQFQPKYLTATITDPPYYDSIAYADLSDFFYVWLKRTMADVYPLNFATPQTPKSDECTALKHHHNGSIEQANKHFENKLLEIFTTIEYQTLDIVSIMFAHQSTEAWTTLCNSILGAKMNITGSWSNDTETTTALKANKAFLSSSVTVACRPTQRKGIGMFKEVKNAIEKKVADEVNSLYHLGFRGADLLTACFGQTVSVFGQYEKVEKADGSEVSVAELLDMAKESAFNALLKGFDGDDFTKFYIGWLQLFGFTESDFDDAAKFARVGLTINVSDLFAHNLFIKKGSKQELAGYQERLKLNHRIGEGSHSFIIDYAHKAMALYEGANRNALLEYIAKVAASPDNSFWRVLTSLCEILPQGSDDYKQASGLLLNKDSLIRESKSLRQSAGEQGQLF